MARMRYGLHWMLVGDDVRIKINHPVYDALAVRTVYTKGGYNLADCDKDVRGYYMTVTPLSGCRGNCRDGAKILLKGVSRRSDKSDAIAKIKGAAILPMAVADVCAMLGATYSFSDMVVF